MPRAYEPLPLRHLLDLVEEDRCLRAGHLIDEGQECREVIDGEAEQAHVFEIAVERLLARPHHLALQDTLATAANPGQDPGLVETCRQRLGQGLETPVPDGSTVIVLPAMAGGAR